MHSALLLWRGFQKPVAYEWKRQEAFSLTDAGPETNSKELLLHIRTHLLDAASCSPLHAHSWESTVIIVTQITSARMHFVAVVAAVNWS